MMSMDKEERAKHLAMGRHLQAISAHPQSRLLHPWGRGAFSGEESARELYEKARSERLSPKLIAAKARLLANILDGHAPEAHAKAKEVEDIALRAAHKAREFKEDREKEREAYA